MSDTTLQNGRPTSHRLRLLTLNRGSKPAQRCTGGANSQLGLHDWNAGDMRLLTTEVSDRRRQGRWSARGTSELPPGVERRSGAAVRSTDLVSHSVSHQLSMPATRAVARWPQTPQASSTKTPKARNTTSLRCGDQEAVMGLANNTPATVRQPNVVNAVGQVKAARTSPNVAGVGNPPR